MTFIIKNANNFEWGSYMIMDVSQKEIDGGYTDPNFPGILDFRVGYIKPERVIEYFDSEKGKIVKEPPICKISIFFKDEWVIDAGIQHFFSKYGEGHGNLIFTNYIKPDDVLNRVVDSKYVVEDKTGILLQITKDILEMKLAKARINIDEGLGGNLIDIERLAEAGNIEFSKELKEVREYVHKKDIEYYSSPEGLDDILDTMIRNLRNEEDFMYYHKEFFELFPEIKFPEGDYKTKFEEKFRFVLNYYNSEIKDCEDEIVKFEKSKREEIKCLEGDMGILFGALSELEKK